MSHAKIVPPETPNLEDYKSPPDREQEHHNEELEAHGKRS